MEKIILSVNGADALFNMDKDLYIGYVNYTNVDRLKAAKRLCKSAIDPESADVISEASKDGSIVEVAGMLLHEYLPEVDVTFVAKDGDQIILSFRKSMEFDDAEIAFTVKQSDYLKLNNGLKSNDLYAPYFNFTMSCINKDDKESLREWMDAPQMPVLIANELYEQSAPDMELFVKKSKPAAKSSKKATSKGS